MSATIGRNRTIDLLTVGVLALALFLLVRPGSIAHTRWTEWRARLEAHQRVERHWNTVATLSTPLFPGGGPPQVVEVSDYECPFCRATSPAVDSAVASGVRVAYLHLPLPNHPAAKGAALAAICAEEEGKFRAMHERLRYTAAWRKDTNWTREAELAGITNIRGFSACLRSDTAKQRLVLHMKLADSLMASLTPIFLSLQKSHKGVISVQQLRDLTTGR
jgi:protein-disulfide isomerase